MVLLGSGITLTDIEDYEMPISETIRKRIQDAGEEAIDILINCSPVGMSPNLEETPISSRHLRGGMVVFDSVYNPPETRLIREAKAAGCVVISGIELFVNQAVGQFELWTKQKAPIDSMRDVVVRGLNNKT